MSKITPKPFRDGKSDFPHIAAYPPVARSGQMVGLGRFELPTSRLSGVRSNQLSYRPHYSAFGAGRRAPSSYDMRRELKAAAR